jgi:hypothetical protein
MGVHAFQNTGRYDHFTTLVVPSKPITLDLMETLGLFFRRACYHWNASYRKNGGIKSCRKPLDLQIRFCSFFGTRFIQRGYETCKKERSKVSMRSKVRGFYGMYCT